VPPSPHYCRRARDSKIAFGACNSPVARTYFPAELKEIMNKPIRVAVTGPAGQIGYALLFRIASGSMFGPDQPLILHLIEIEPAMPALQGLVMELEDGVGTRGPTVAFGLGDGANS